MRYAIDVIPLDFSRGNIVDVRIKGFRRVIGSTLVAQRGGLALADINGHAKKSVQCALIIEWDPEGPDRECRFVGIPVGLCVDSAGADAISFDHVATLTVPGQPPFAIYAVPVRATSTTLVTAS